MKVTVPQIRTALLKQSYLLKQVLIGAGQMQTVEDRDEDVSRDQEPQEVGAPQEPILGFKSVDLSWCSQDGHG